MIVVRTKEELQEAIKNKVDSIRIEGPYAKTFANAVRSRRRKAKVAKGAIGFGALAVVSAIIIIILYAVKKDFHYTMTPREIIDSNASPREQRRMAFVGKNYVKLSKKGFFENLSLVLKFKKR